MRYLSIGLLLLASPAIAGVHHYTFAVTATTGAMAGISSVGTFSYDDQGLFGTRVLGLPFRDFDFTWNGVSYDASDVLGGSMWLDSTGALDFDSVSSYFGSRCGVGFCGVGGSRDNWNVQFGLASNLGGLAPGQMIFRYSAPFMETVQIGTATITSVPEPATVGLLLGALALIGLRRRVKG